MSRRRLIIGNWKMNTTRSEALALATSLRDSRAYRDLDFAVCPPFLWIEPIWRVLSGTQLAVGGQDCWHEPSGAFTGQVSPTQLAELCTLVIVGHSEHRRDAGESNELVGLKAVAALEADLMPIVCVGESIETRQAGEAQQWVEEQVSAVIEVVGEAMLAKCVFAYEPIWAIGSGMSANADDAQQMAAFVRELIGGASEEAAETVRMLYGGSVNPDNAASYVDQPDVDGLLVGGASLQADSFLGIADAC